ncbi:MAG: hypothetical protein FWE71_01875 [Nocardioidaceae bacterium]|nr:hypothetical protein [Nocardioidaceae bacterium]MCL2613847.1 hypothetical protein [Nocardioidaceae bacterium]
MGFIITGTMLGVQEREGTLDNGNPWHVKEIVVLDGLATLPVRVENFAGPLPERGEQVAIDVEVRYGKYIGLKRNDSLERALAATAGK